MSKTEAVGESFLRICPFRRCQGPPDSVCTTVQHSQGLREQNKKEKKMHITKVQPQHRRSQNEVHRRSDEGASVDNLWASPHEDTEKGVEVASRIAAEPR